MIKVKSKYALIALLIIFLIGVWVPVLLPRPAVTVQFPNKVCSLEQVVKIMVIGKEINYYTGEPIKWSGSGILIKDDFVLTAGHVVANANEVTIILQNGEEYSGGDWYEETGVDVGFIRVFTPEKESKLNFADALLGEETWIIGYPLGDPIVLTKGIVASTNWLGFLFVDTPSWPGNSGSPVLNKNGCIVGMLVAGPREWESMSLCVPSEIINLSLKKYLAIKALENAS